MRFFLGLFLSLSLCFSTLVSTVNAQSNSSIFSNTAPGTDAGTGTNTGDASENVTAPALSLTASSALLMDATTGTILYAQNAEEEHPIASVTKIMTLLLIFRALHDQTIQLEDSVIVSAHAAGMGGSQVYLEEGETQTVETLIKCIVVASANDACVAMAEQIAGSEEAFVQRMNETAAALGMQHTHFVNCCGLDTEGHYSTAHDIALMSRELTVNYPEIFNYTSIWMEDITHHTARGNTTFTLSNTNHLIKQYPYATGLKTGFTSAAGFCLSATASKDDLNLIAVVLNAPSSMERIADVKTLFEWGFANCRVYTDENLDPLPVLPVSRGRLSELYLKYDSAFHYLDTANTSGELTKKLELPDSVEAPIKEGDRIGKAVYTLAGQTVGSVDLLAAETIPLLTLKDAWQQILHRFFLYEPA
ncbi:D-alanyl-D-alanine carboxypeptidase family protein [uncultured Eubacterium sp.]|uniref:D-alanyl-D-alanine carboxypeptidase family protein n=1 Tax=uncultured Eubacterium sp. TaxID=165185 RepID=UPI0025E6D3D5|nr:D-alanyl-D-alanine carboxypeptidase family protein [uncultured Eubacterium sp.]MCI6536443.1 D-alanyl-D-alanine carboxypeptidase [Lachnospiraceae bacterium]